MESIRDCLDEIFKMPKPIQVCFFLQSAPAPPLPLVAALPFLLPPAATAVWGDGGASCEGSSACSEVIEFYIFIHKAAAEVFCILAVRVSIPCGAAQCLFTVFFLVPCCCCFCACVSICFSHF